MPITITHVARKAGVSVGTVSRVINGRRDVDATLRARVERVIQELKYQPHGRARGPARNSSSILAFVLSNRDLLHPFHARVLQGATEYSRECGYAVLYIPYSYSPSCALAEIDLPQALRANGLAGCLILGGTNHPNLLRRLDAAGISYVLLANNYVPGCGNREPIDQVRFDEVGGSYEAVKYLTDLGHREIWYIGDVSLPWYKARYEGYLRAMKEAQLPPHALASGLSDQPYTNGRLSMEFILDRGFPVTAVFAGTDENAHGAWEELGRRGLETPKDISLIGFDDFRGPVRALGLTTVQFDAIELGRQLAKLAIAKILDPGSPIPEVLIPTRLMKLATCRPFCAQACA